MNSDEAYEDYARRMSHDVAASVRATGRYDFENDWYEIHYNPETDQVEVTYKGPLEEPTDR